MHRAVDRGESGTQRGWGAVYALALAGVVACGEPLPTAQRPVVIPMNLPVLAELRGHVDLETGTMTFEAATPSGHVSGLSQAIYGDQNVLVRLYNTPVSQTVVSAKKQFSANVGIQNLRSHPIGDEQGAASPADTMGIYVFFTSGPTITASSPCGACSVTVKNQHGTLAFTAPGQKYFHWQERLSGFGGGSDTTRNRKTWTFEADTQVTNFSFLVLVNAAWPPPDETRWKIDYEGDSLPDTQSEPRWRRQTSGAATVTATSGILSITAEKDNEVSFYRQDSITQAANAYAETRMRLVTDQNSPLVGLRIHDGTRYVALGMDNREVGFIDSNGDFLGGTYTVSTLTFRTYQLRKYAADSAVFFVDGVRRGKQNYTSLSTSALSSRVKFGSLATAGDDNTSEWDYVIYEIGATQP